MRFSRIGEICTNLVFNLILIDKALEVINLKLEEDNTLRERTPLEPDIN